MPGMFLPRLGLPDLWIGLKYEKLSELCYKCGTLGHAEKECFLCKALLSNQHGIRFPAFGEWLRIENDRALPDIYERINNNWEPQSKATTEDELPLFQVSLVSLVWSAVWIFYCTAFDLSPKMTTKFLQWDPPQPETWRVAQQDKRPLVWYLIPLNLHTMMPMPLPDKQLRLLRPSTMEKLRRLSNCWQHPYNKTSIIWDQRW